MRFFYQEKYPKIKKTYFMGIPVVTRRNDGDNFYYDFCGVQVYQREHKQLIKAENKPVQQKKAENKEPMKRNQNPTIGLDRSCLNVAIKLTGGLGDLLVAANYLHVLYESLDSNEVRFYLFAHKDIKIARTVFRGMPFVFSLKTLNDIEDSNKDYDLFFEIQRYPFVRHKDTKRIYRYAPFLIEVISLWDRFRIENSRYWLRAPWFDGLNQIEIIQNRKRIQQPDVYSRLGLGEDFKPQILIAKSEKACLDNLGLNGKRFVTIHRGVDSKMDKDSTKLWPQEYYSLLVHQLKTRHPEITIVQLGVSEERCPKVPEVDIYLAGKTDLDDVKILLKNAAIHIDGEGGFVHLRHALHGGKSVVLFGPTSISFFGYSENVNLQQTACACVEGCEWIRPDWQKRCIAGYKRNACMYAITPELILMKIEELL